MTNIRVEKVAEGNYILHTVCPICGKEHSTAIVKSQDWWDFNHGKHVQDAFPYLSVDDRELLITGIDAGCWN